MRTAAAASTVAAVLRLVPIEWVALGLSIVAMALAVFAIVKVARAVRQIADLTDRQAVAVSGLTAEASNVQSKLPGA